MLITIIIITTHTHTHIRIIHSVHLCIMLFISKINNESKMNINFAVKSLSLSESQFPSS